MAFGSFKLNKPRRFNKAKKLKSLSAPARKQVTKIANTAIHRNNPDKTFFLVTASALVTSTMTFTHISPIAVGGTPRTRVALAGGIIRLKSVSIRGRATIGTNALGNYIRVILIKWKPDMASAAPASGQLLSNDSTVQAPNQELDPNVSNSKLIVLADRLLRVDTVNQPENCFKIYKKLNHKIVYNDADTAGTSGTGQLFLCYVSNSATATVPSIEFVTTLRFEEN